MGWICPAEIFRVLLVRAIVRYSWTPCFSAAFTEYLEMMEGADIAWNCVRYGNVRNLDFSKVGDMLEAMNCQYSCGV